VLPGTGLGINQLGLQLRHPGVQRRDLILEQSNLAFQEGDVRLDYRRKRKPYLRGQRRLLVHSKILALIRRPAYSPWTITFTGP
jgi:hypothetical protein